MYMYMYMYNNIIIAIQKMAKLMRAKFFEPPHLTKGKVNDRTHFKKLTRKNVDLKFEINR